MERPAFDLRNLTDDALATMLQNCLRAMLHGTKYAEAAQRRIGDVQAEFRRRTEAAGLQASYVQTPEVGLLRTIGYSVGNTGESTHTRQLLLDYVMSQELPFVGSIPYMLAWGPPLSVTRFNKLVRTLESFATNAEDRPALALACDHWWADRDYVQAKWRALV